MNLSQYINKTLVLGVIRGAINSLGTYLVTAGIFTQSDANTLAGAALVIATYVFSAISNGNSGVAKAAIKNSNLEVVTTVIGGEPVLTEKEFLKPRGFKE